MEITLIIPILIRNFSRMILQCIPVNFNREGGGGGELQKVAG